MDFEQIRKEIEHPRKEFTNLETILQTYDQMVNSYTENYTKNEISMLEHAYWHCGAISNMPLFNSKKLNRLNEVLHTMSHTGNIHVPINFLSDISKHMKEDYFKFEETFDLIEKYAMKKNASNLYMVTSSITAYFKNGLQKSEINHLLELFDFCHGKEYEEDALVKLNLWTHRDFDNLPYLYSFRELNKKFKNEHFFKVLQTFDHLVSPLDLKKEKVLDLSNMLSSYQSLSDLNPENFKTYYFHKRFNDTFVCEDYFTTPLPLSCVNVLSDYLKSIKVPVDIISQDEFSLWIIDRIQLYDQFNICGLLSKTEDLEEKEKIFIDYFNERNNYFRDNSSLNITFEYLIDRNITDKEYSNSLNQTQKEELMKAYETSLGAYATINYDDPHCRIISKEVVKEEIEKIFFNVYNEELSQLGSRYSLQEKQEVMYQWANNVIRLIRTEPERMLEFFEIHCMYVSSILPKDL